MITREDLIDVPVHIYDMQDFILAEFPCFLSEYHDILNKDQRPTGGYSKKESLRELSERWMLTPEKVEDCEKWLLNKE